MWWSSGFGWWYWINGHSYGPTLDGPINSVPSMESWNGPVLVGVVQLIGLWKLKIIPTKFIHRILRLSIDFGRVLYILQTIVVLCSPVQSAQIEITKQNKQTTM